MNMQIPTSPLQKTEKIILYIILLAFLVIPIISLFKVSSNCLDAVNESQFKSDYQRYINQTYSNNKSDEEKFEQFNTNYKLNKTKRSDYDKYLGTIKHFDSYFYIKMYTEIALIVIDFLMIVFIISIEYGVKILNTCCIPCLAGGCCSRNDYTGCLQCFKEGSLFNPLTMQSIISLFLFIMSIVLVSEINSGRSQLKKLIEKIRQNNSKNNIEDIIIISDPLSDLYGYKKGIILFLIFYLLLIIATITYSILRKVYFSKNLSLFPTVNKNQTETQVVTPATNSKNLFNKN